MRSLFSDLQKEFELEPGEMVLVEARKHWFVFTIELLPFAALAILPFAISPMIERVPQLAPYASFASMSEGASRAALAIWLLAVWTASWGFFTRYYLHVWVLTNLRVVEVTQHGFFSREVSSMLLARVQDVTTEVSGVLFSLLGIGNIHVQSAGAVDEFHMNGVGEPEKLRDLILSHTSRHTPDHPKNGAV
jgi:membrane protein YdbS with pleckstrin-like domain